METVVPNAAHSRQTGNRQMVSAAIASCLGWSLDLFDLFVLLYVAPVVGKLFFPSTHPTLSLAAVYASFAVTLLMRPLGAALFGSYADRHGRKGAMIVAVIGVGVSTALFGALPTTHQIGGAAAILFLALRLVQGVFVGGVVASTHTIGTESVPPRWRGVMSGLIGGGGAGIGALLASLVFLVTSSIFPGDAFAVWGWRCMFFAGLISSVLGLFIFKNLEESPSFRQLQAQAKQGHAANAERSPLRTLFAGEYRKVLFGNLMLTIGCGAGYYLSSGYIPTFLKVINHVPNHVASMILIASSVVAIVACLLSGYLSDRIGRKKTFLICGVVQIFVQPAMYPLMAGTTDVGTVAAGALILTFLGNAAYAPLLIFLNERFPTQLRASGTGLSWNLGFAVGGMMPTFVSLFAGSLGNLPFTLSMFLGGICALYLVGALVVPETRGRTL